MIVIAGITGLRYVGVNTRNEAGQIREIPVSYPHFVSFSDVSIGHRISSHDQISDPLQNPQVVQIELR